MEDDKGKAPGGKAPMLRADPPIPTPKRIFSTQPKSERLARFGANLLYVSSS